MASCTAARLSRHSRTCNECRLSDGDCGRNECYKSAWNAWEHWCALNGWTVLPADTNGLKVYIAHLADNSRTLATISAYLAAIASAHSIAGQPFDRAALKDALKGVRREKARPQRQARPLVASTFGPFCRTWCRACRPTTGTRHCWRSASPVRCGGRSW
jgi:hypothetical protein